MRDHFVPFALSTGPLASVGPDEHATRLSAWSGAALDLDDDGTHFGYVWRGPAAVACGSGSFELTSGMYFAVPGAATVSGSGAGIVATRLGFRGLFMIGGPVEGAGRLRYIDGCTDSLLVPPVMRGDACLNALFFPPGIDQTEHTHPTARVGLVASGGGECVTPERTFALEPGLAFVIPAGARHRFRTNGAAMVVVAYHPDSDTGPTHESHPMINRTMVDGVSASEIETLHTRPR